jgi:hypothetical protein
LIAARRPLSVSSTVAFTSERLALGIRNSRRARGSATVFNANAPVRSSATERVNVHVTGFVLIRGKRSADLPHLGRLDRDVELREIDREVVGDVDGGLGGERAGEEETQRDAPRSEQRRAPQRP